MMVLGMVGTRKEWIFFPSLAVAALPAERIPIFMTEKKKVVVAMSGGVDSTLTAKLLLEAGYEVCGATMHQFDGQEKEIEGASAMAE